MTETILFVDDEPKILEAYRRTLRKKFTLVVAESGKQALELMETEGPFPVVVSDMQMPEMNGVVLLEKIKKQYPQTVRLMLTGNADQKTAIDAINTSDVHRFLNKPCPPDAMTEALNEALDFYRLQRVEKDMLEKTVKGSIVALVEVLSIAKPAVFGRVGNIRRLAVKTAQAMGLSDLWEIETLALLAQIGLISLPDALLEKVLKGAPLSEEEIPIYQRYPEIGAKVLGNIPRLESVADAIKLLEVDGRCDEGVPLSVKVVKPIIDLVNARFRDLSIDEAYSFIASSPNNYDADVMQALHGVISKVVEGKVVEMNVSQLKEGMELAKEIRTHSGALLIEKGQRLNESMVARLVNFAHSSEIDEKVMVFMPAEPDSSESVA